MSKVVTHVEISRFEKRVVFLTYSVFLFLNYSDVVENCDVAIVSSADDKMYC